MRFLLAVWSIVAWSLAFTVMLLLTFAVLPVMLLGHFERRQGGWPTAVMGWVPRLTLSGRSMLWDRRFDPKRICVYVANHTSMLDGFVAVDVLPHPICGVENASHLDVPGYGWLMRIGNSIPIPRGEHRTSAFIAEATERASRGISIIAFPEGHRTPDGAVRPFKRGVFVMARAVGLPIVPVAVRGMYKMLPKGTWIVTPAHLEVYLGPTLETRDLTDEQLDDLAARSQKIIAAFLERRETANPDPFVPPHRPGPRDRIPADWLEQRA